MAAIRIKSDKELAGLGLRVDPDDPNRLIPLRGQHSEAKPPAGAEANSASKREAGREGVGGGDPPRSAAPAGGTPDNSGPIQVDPRIEAVLPPPSASEAAFLERRLLADRDRPVELAVWSDGWRLLDDFHTYRLCVKHRIAYNIRLVDLPDLEAAIRWRLMANLGQLNLSPLQAAYARGRLYLSLRRRPGRPRKEDEGDRPAPGSTDEELATRWGLDGRTVRRDAAFSRALMTIEGRLGVAFRDKILCREYPLTRKETVAWAKDIRGRVIDEGEIGRRVETILEQRRGEGEGPETTTAPGEPDATSADQTGDAAGPAGPRPDSTRTEGEGRRDEAAAPVVEPAAGPAIIDAQPAETPLIRLFKAWDDASLNEKRAFAEMPEVYALAVEGEDRGAEAPSSAEGAAGA